MCSDGGKKEDGWTKSDSCKDKWTGKDWLQLDWRNKSGSRFQNRAMCTEIGDRWFSKTRVLVHGSSLRTSSFISSQMVSNSNYLSSSYHIISPNLLWRQSTRAQQNTDVNAGGNKEKQNSKCTSVLLKNSQNTWPVLRSEEFYTTVDVDGAVYRWNHSPSWLVWSDGRQLFGVVLHPSHKPSELSRWLRHDDCVRNTVLSISYRAAWNADAVLRWEFCLSVRPSVRPSDKRVHCDKTEERYVYLSVKTVSDRVVRHSLA